MCFLCFFYPNKSLPNPRSQNFFHRFPSRSFIILTLNIRPTIHFSSSLHRRYPILSSISCPFSSSLHMRYSIFSSIICWKEYHFLIKLPWLLCWKLTDNICVHLFLVSAFCYMFILVQTWRSLEFRYCQPSNIVIFSQNYFSFSKSFALP